MIAVKQDWTAGGGPNDEDDIALQLGPRLRTARESRHVSLRALAQRTGFSPSFLSQVELGQSSPSLASLQRICDALEVDLPDVLRDPLKTRAAPAVLRRAEREAVRSEWSRASAESLLPNGGDERFSALLLSIDAGGCTGTLPTRRGAKQFAYCIRGKVRLTLGEACHALASGDSVVIDQTNAAWENHGQGRAEVLVFSIR